MTKKITYSLLFSLLMLIGFSAQAQIKTQVNRDTNGPRLRKGVVVKKSVFLERAKRENWGKLKTNTKWKKVKSIAIFKGDAAIVIRNGHHVVGKKGNDWIINASQTIRVRLFEGKVKIIRCSCPDKDEDSCQIQWNSTENAYDCVNETCCEAEVFWERDGVRIRTIQ